MPWGDWQFWLVTIIAAIAFWVVAKRFIPRRKTRNVKHADSDLAQSSSHRVRLTVNKKRV